jgi:plastocyanin
MRRFLAASIASLVLVVPACGTNVSGPQTYRVGVDADSPEGKNFQYSTFFPSTIKASPGDSIVFENHSTQAPHTITFGVDERRSNQPAVVLPNGTENPVVREPCFVQAGAKPQLTKCPDKQLPAYDGSGYWNSGFLNPAPAPGTKDVTLELSDSIEPGQYAYLCLLHGPMAGVLEVVEEGERETADAVDEVGEDALADVRSAAQKITDPDVGANTVAAGWSGGVTAVNRFAPQTIEVKAGTTVSWEAFSEYEPHTVSFGPNYKAGVPGPGSTVPKGPKSGGTYTSGEASSGIFGKQGGPFPPGPYSLRFPTAGSYAYVCVLHPQMRGVVKVT